MALLPTDGGYYAILNRQTGKALDVTGASLDNGALIQEYDFVNGFNQQWRFELVDGTYCKIVSRATGKVLDVVDASTANTAGVQQWDYLGGRNQLWQAVACRALHDREPFKWQRARGSGRKLRGWSQDPTGTQTDQPKQHWQLVPVAGGYSAIVNAATGEVLDVTSASTANTALIQQYRFLGGANQQWQPLPLAGGYYAIRNLGSAKALDVVDASTSPGALIQQYRYLGGGNQQWWLLPVAQ